VLLRKNSQRERNDNFKAREDMKEGKIQKEFLTKRKRKERHILKKKKKKPFRALPTT